MWWVWLWLGIISLSARVCCCSQGPVVLRSPSGSWLPLDQSEPGVAWVWPITARPGSPATRARAGDEGKNKSGLRAGAGLSRLSWAHTTTETRGRHWPPLHPGTRGGRHYYVLCLFVADVLTRVMCNFKLGIVIVNLKYVAVKIYVVL